MEAQRYATHHSPRATCRWAAALACALLLGADEAYPSDNRLNVRFANVTVAPRDAKTATVTFDIAWEDSWRHEVNHDAAWVFFKVRAAGATEWQHARLVADRVLNPTGYGQEKISPLPDGAAPFHFPKQTQSRRKGNAESHPDLFTTGAAKRAKEADTPLEFIVPDGEDGFTGLFVRRAADGNGTTRARKVTVVLDLTALQGITDIGKAQIRAFGVQMVYVAEGLFYLGAGGVEVYAFHRYIDGVQNTQPYRVTGPGGIPTGRQKGRLWAWKSAQPEDGGELPASFPNGYAAFYCMKCLILPGQYIDFLRTLTGPQAEARYNRYVVKRSGKSPNYTYSGIPVGIRLGPGCLGLSWADGAAFAAWAGLRPMTELECEKLLRGPCEPIPDEVGPGYWGVKGFGTYDWDAFKGHNHSVERVVTVGNAAGRRFKGTHGRGTPTLPADWPQEDAVGAGMRCSWFTPGRGLDLPRTRMSDRFLTAAVIPERHGEYRWRGVRTAPKGVGP